MTSWQRVQYIADDYKSLGYCLCVEMDDSISCRVFPGNGIVQEKFLWCFVGCALVNKLSGKVLEASADIGKSPTLRAGSNPLRRSQTWSFEKNHVLRSKNDRTLVIPSAPRGILPEQLPVIGVQYNPQGLPSGVGCWRLVPVHEDLVSHIDLSARVVSMPPQKMQERMSPETVPKKAFVPPDDEINLKELLFDSEFCRQHNECYTTTSAEDLEHEFFQNGINNGRWGSPIFNVKFYLECQEDLRKNIGAGNYAGAVAYFLDHCDEPIQTSELFNWTIYRTNPHLVHLTPKQLFWDYYHNGHKQHIRAA